MIGTDPTLFCCSRGAGVLAAPFACVPEVTGFARLYCWQASGGGGGSSSGAGHSSRRLPHGTAPPPERRSSHTPSAPPPSAAAPTHHAAVSIRTWQALRATAQLQSQAEFTSQRLRKSSLPSQRTTGGGPEAKAHGGKSKREAPTHRAGVEDAQHVAQVPARAAVAPPRLKVKDLRARRQQHDCAAPSQRLPARPAHCCSGCSGGAIKTWAVMAATARTRRQ